MENNIVATSSAGDVQVEQADIIQLLREHEATTTRLIEAVRAREAEYQQLQQLHANHEALRNAIVNPVLAVSDERKIAVAPYILVLVDAQSHQFRENYVHGAESDGIKAAALLKNAVTQQCDSNKWDPSSCHTTIRVYANLKKLSVDAVEEYAAKNLGFGKPPFPRALGAFAAGFSHDDASVDYVDVASDAAVEHKICGLFEIGIKDTSCHQVFFGASGSPQYARVLRENLMFAEKITLIQRGDEDISLMSMGLQSVIFSEVFEPLKLNHAAFVDKKEPMKRLQIDKSSTHSSPTRSPVGSNQRKFFQTRFELLRSHPDHLVPLPLKGPPGTIPINAAGHRIDMHMNTPSKRQWDEYQFCISTRRLCNSFHLRQGCNNEHCKYDHDPITFNEGYCHRFVQRSWPCHNGGKCRDIYCYKGHICHCEKLKNGRVTLCKMPREYHGIDRRVKDWATPDEECEGQDENDSGRQSRTESVPDIPIFVENLIDL